MFLFQWTLRELFDIIVMTLAVGYIFHDVFRAIPNNPVERYLHKRKGFQWNDFWFACAVVAPAIVLHELGHKFVALGFGLSATFEAAYLWLLIGIALKLLRFNFIFFVPAFVSIMGAYTVAEHALVAFAGPGVNLVLFLVSWLVIHEAKRFRLTPRARYYFTLSKQINFFLFVFNMLPLPFFDGYAVWTGLFHMIFG